MPDQFVALPPGFERQQPASLNLRKLSHAQLLAAAARHAARHMPVAAGDPSEATLAGVVERARLRPGVKPAVAFTLGGGPKGTIYSKAWGSIGRSMRQAVQVGRRAGAWPKVTGCGRRGRGGGGGSGRHISCSLGRARGM
jgi:hypothetical protein